MKSKNREKVRFRLHPLIHTLLNLDLAQDIADTKKSKPKLRQKTPRGGGIGRLS